MVMKPEVLPSPVESLETNAKFQINSSTPETLLEESTRDASTKQKRDDAKDASEHELGGDQFAAPLSKRMKSL
ncbi:hypothetical protein Lal_00048080 [Lupinus albus]|nr:hypothetical protein Lal_00048080 [Lupinus albus]